ncbi:MAG: universal stress protein [Desulfarculaceae bacterium]|nr:universal stress protein [Desulfarculaceae bacterium]MCF8071056.1 universal stress protein [Desulfarculaceae bacterium]MCF8100644.1 universal stress protein [Desulfarculaceae bacterium]MCF8116922.1 universal stress protein [Desulfarculaceae bacterium]
MTQPEIKKVLCAVDFSDYSDDVVTDAFNICSNYEAELLLVNVVNERVYEELERIGGRFEMLGGVADKAIAEKEEHRARRMRELLGAAQERGLPLDQVTHSSRIAVGVPYERILEVAEEYGAHLIIMGAKGRTSLAKTLRFGSTAEKIFRRSQCRVMFVR